MSKKLMNHYLGKIKLLTDQKKLGYVLASVTANMNLTNAEVSEINTEVLKRKLEVSRKDILNK